jgi:probable rRNA maturation factor
MIADAMATDQMNNVIVAVEQDHDGWSSALSDIDRICRSATIAALSVAGWRDEGCEISLLLTDDARIRDLNRDWRGKDAPTNVLAFPCSDGADDNGSPCLLGDVVLAYQTVASEAVRDGNSLSDHLCHLVIHGVLHLLGEDHETDAEARRMEQMEVKALGLLGIGDPYAGHLLSGGEAT